MEYIWGTFAKGTTGLRIDAQTALDYVVNDPHLSKTHIVRTSLS